MTALARVGGGVVSLLPWAPSPLSPSTRRRGPGDEDKQLQLQLQYGYRQEQDDHRGSWKTAKMVVGRHELTSFLDDADVDDFELSPSTPTTTITSSASAASVSDTAASSVFVIDSDIIPLPNSNATDNDKTIDRPHHHHRHHHHHHTVTTTTTTTSTAINESYCDPRDSSFFSSARTSLDSADLASCYSATATATTATTITTATMAPLTMANALFGAGAGARNNGKTTTTATATAAGGRTSDGSAEWTHDDLWDYMHHGLDGHSSPDLRLLTPRDTCREREKQPSSPARFVSQAFIPARPDSSRSQRRNNTRLQHQPDQLHPSPRSSCESITAANPTAPTPAPVPATSSSWTLRGAKTHEKSSSSSSSGKTMTASNAMTTIPTIHGVRERLSAEGSNTTTTMSTSTSTTAMATAMAPPPVSPSTASFGAQMTKQEFEALPEAIQRKDPHDHAPASPNITSATRDASQSALCCYFSSLERLHFASLAPAPSPPPNLNLLDPNFVRPETSPGPQTIKQRRRARQARLASDQVSDRVKRRSSRRSRVTSSSASFYVRLPDKIKRRHLTTEEQLVASRHRRHDIILDPADEAIYKVRRRASSVVSPDELYSPTLEVRPQTMETQPSRREEPRASSVDTMQTGSNKSRVSPLPTPPSTKRDSFYDSFRWLEEDDELDLRLQLDDYHANLRDDLPSSSKQRRPSFRRHLSISKAPFGRNSLSMNRPGTTQAVTSNPASPMLSNPPSSSPPIASPGHGRRRSRALSLITPKHSPQDTVGAFDPEAAHYQDPEARLKLRLYLASPQRFDEAIEFGFPSKEAMVPQTANAKQRPKPASPAESENLRTFLADDRSSIYSEDGSLDSDSPKTPQTVENATALRPPPIKSDRAYSPKPSNEFGGHAESREMTLRMTLTRPDLRANQDQIYGWQQKCCPPGRKSQSNALRDDFASPAYARDGTSKESIERQFAAMDHWNAQASEGGVMKRFWNKVRRGPA
ncbi:hypothetical protein C8035_v012196 [Colletotrichum spinosum]|uniref:Uncharacterized protein n=1 Tax=Colletotrichum spinosum TaxID=1347390 RepID=A0A4R8Q786_9PEZI|nr:hypothetical protein C8035_v012196 [Colletotrichum spinosum]